MPLEDILGALRAEGEEAAAREAGQAGEEARAMLEEARREAERVGLSREAETLRAARDEAEALVGRARAEARRRVERARAEGVEEVLLGLSGTMEELRGSPGYPEVFRLLLAEARQALPEAGRLRVDPRDRDLARREAPDLEVLEEPIPLGGLVLETVDGGLAADNTLRSRLQGLEDSLRREIGGWIG